ncbi:MAG TPA: response regulator [Candidatus Bathyarchaeia archaeon]|nr:response regulator [Candidatus Bathyarchaeia archaeon]
MQITKIAITVAVIIILFEVVPVKSVWSIPVRQADEHMIAVPGSGGFSLLLKQKQEAYKTLTKEQQRFWKRILIVDDNVDITVCFKTAIEDNNNTTLTKKIEVHTSNNPVMALSEFKPNFYDLLLVDINMPHMNGFQLCEKILAIDINVKVCFMSSVEINREALREIYPSLSLGCFIRKPVTMDYLLKRIRSELD